MIENSLNISQICVIILVIGLPLLYIGSFLFHFIEIVFLRNFKKPLFVFTTLLFVKRTNEEQRFLSKNCNFYNRLQPKYQKHFEHRVAKFIKKYRFVGNDILVTREMKILIALNYIKLTFGSREYLTSVFDTIVIHPDIYESEIPNQFHKGEFNPKRKMLQFSWKHFIEGNLLPRDNLHLGLHEFAHVLHHQSKKKSTVQAILFRKSAKSIFNLLKNLELKQRLLASGYLREYAYENQYEFIAVVLEHFFETPTEFKSQFPEIYLRVKQMINYNDKIFIS